MTQHGNREIGRPAGFRASHRSRGPFRHHPLRPAELPSSGPRPPDPPRVSALVGILPDQMFCIQFALEAQRILNDVLDRLLADAEALEARLLEIEQ